MGMAYVILLKLMDVKMKLHVITIQMLQIHADGYLLAGKVGNLVELSVVTTLKMYMVFHPLIVMVYHYVKMTMILSVL